MQKGIPSKFATIPCGLTPLFSTPTLCGFLFFSFFLVNKLHEKKSPTFSGIATGLRAGAPVAKQHRAGIYQSVGSGFEDAPKKTQKKENQVPRAKPRKQTQPNEFH